MQIPNVIRFWLFLIFVIPSILCSIFSLYYFLVDRTLRKAPSNHVIILILFLDLFYNTTDIIWLINFYRTGFPLSFTPIFCLIWTYIDIAPFISVLLLVAWEAIERHILVFHNNWLRTQTQRFFLHYLPLFVCSIYPLLYYFVGFFVLTCKIQPDYSQYLCNLAECAFENTSLGLWDSIAHSIIPTFIIVIFSIALIGRVWYSKYRAGQRFQWSRYKRLTIQLLSVSAVYCILYFPPMILNMVYLAGLSRDVGAGFFLASLYVAYFAALIVPFVCAVSLPELRTKLRMLTRIWHRARPAVVPEALTMDRLRLTRSVRMTPTVL